MHVRFFEINEMRTFQKILQVKSPYQSDIQGKGNLGANTKFLGSQNLHGSRELYFYNGSNKYVLKVQLHYKSYTSCIMPARTYLWCNFGAFLGTLGQFRSHF